VARANIDCNEANGYLISDGRLVDSVDLMMVMMVMMVNDDGDDTPTGAGTALTSHAQVTFGG